MQIEDILDVLGKNFPDEKFTNVNQIELSVYEYMREISRQFLETKIQEEINNTEKELLEKEDTLKVINTQKKNVNSIYGEIVLRRRYFEIFGNKADNILEINRWLVMAERLITLLSIQDCFD